MSHDRASWMEVGLELDRAGAVALDVEPAGSVSGDWQALLDEYRLMRELKCAFCGADIK